MVAFLLMALAILLPQSQGLYGQVQETFCSPDNRAGNLDRCLAAIRYRAHDKVNSAFGESYLERCPADGAGFNAINCFQLEPITEPMSLAEVTFRVDNPDLSTIDHFLDIQYTSSAGSYTGCDHTYNYSNKKRFSIDPLSDATYPTWDLRELPRVTWYHAHGDVFTLIVLHPNWLTRAVISNIDGNDFTYALVLYGYQGLGNEQNVPRPMPFILYKQTKLLLPERIPRNRFNISAFAERNQLEGPVALSWVTSAYDADMVERHRFKENCASLVEDALQLNPPNVEYIPHDVELRVFLRVHHTTNPAPYDCGIYTITPPLKDFYLDPINPESFTVEAADFRAGSVTTMTMNMKRVIPEPSDFDGKLHTIMVISSTTKYLHGFIVNVEGDSVTLEDGHVSTGYTPIPFMAPNAVHHGRTDLFFFLAYEQLARIPTNLTLTPYLSCSGTREFTNITGFISNYQMTLVGVSRMMFNDDDEYSRCRQENT